MKNTLSWDVTIYRLEDHYLTICSHITEDSKFQGYIVKNLVTLQ
jgi:hypothetical protein